MRKLSKGPEPLILVKNGEKWTKSYVEAESAEDRRQHEKWRHAEIRQCLSGETGGKCAYCEANVADASYPHVEHLTPKSIRRDLAHDWLNLTFACQRCNTSKGDYFDEELALLNPYLDDVDALIQLMGGFAHPALGEPRAELTVNRLDLNRIDLCNSRIRRLTSIHQILERWHAASGQHKEVLAAAIEKDSSEGEFTATVLNFLENVGFPTKRSQDPQPNSVAKNPADLRPTADRLEQQD